MGLWLMGGGEVTFPVAIRGRDDGAEIEWGSPSDPAHSLRAASGGSGGSSKSMVCVTRDVTHTLTAEGSDASEDGTGRATPIVPAFIHENQRGEVRMIDKSNSLTTGGGKPGQGYPATLNDFGVRRLSPVECERLQGFPDNWTATGITDDGTEVAISDSQRYRQLGNSVAIPVVEWIARRLVAVDKELNEPQRDNG